MDAILVLVPCPSIQRKDEYSKLSRKEALRQYQLDQFSDTYIRNIKKAVLDRMEKCIPSFSNTILHEVIDTPITYADQYNVGAGTPFGLSHGLGQLSLNRPIGPSSSQRRSPPIKNIMYCGASTRPGNGVPLVLTSAKLVARKAIEYIKNTI